MDNKTLLLGADPEMFVKGLTSGTISSAAGLLGCTKQEKLTICTGVRLQEDNVLAEFDIDPVDSFAGFNSLVSSGIEHTRRILNPLGLDIAEGVSSHIYTKAEIESFHERALEFGCTPDYNGFTGVKNPSPQASNKGLRSAGGHIHFGFDKSVSVTAETQSLMTILCDLFLGMPSLLLDEDTRRRKLYGKAGAIRYKDYGIEYRTLSNFWIFQEQQRRWAYEQATKAYEGLKTGQVFEFIAMVSPEEIQRVINQNDKAMAEQYVLLTKVM